MSPRPEDASDPAGGPDADPEEIELKLAVGEPGVIRALIRRPPVGGIAGFVPAGRPRSVTCMDRYFDTAALNGALRLGGFRARLREREGTLILTLKSAASRDGAVSRRIELEGPATTVLDPERWPPSAARSRLKALLDGRPMVEIAALRQRRLQRDFVRDGTTVEISLDRMTALEGGRILATRVEVEAELLSGDLALLHGLAAALEILPGVRPASSSKLAFALAARVVASA